MIIHGPFIESVTARNDKFFSAYFFVVSKRNSQIYHFVSSVRSFLSRHISCLYSQYCHILPNLQEVGLKVEPWGWGWPQPFPSRTGTQTHRDTDTHTTYTHNTHTLNTHTTHKQHTHTHTHIHTHTHTRKHTLTHTSCSWQIPRPKKKFAQI